MDELERRLLAILPALGEPAWSERREQGLRNRVDRALAFRGAVGRPAVAAALALAAGAALWFGLQTASPSTASTAGAQALVPGASARLAPNHAVVFSDGSRADALSVDMRLVTRAQDSRRVEAELATGAARFEVVPNRAREFVIRAGNVSVSVLGTVFTVAHEGPRVHVAVLVGKVRVDWAGGSTTLAQDSEGVFPPAPEVLPPEPPVDSAQIAATSPSATSLEGASRKRWSELARAGDFRAAYLGLAAAGPGGVRDVPEELLLAADVARRAGHAAEAAGHLERLLARHPRDSRADVAAFTLGRIRLQLGRAGAAAAAFEQVLASGGPLAEDALYRAVMAWQQAGQQAKAEPLRRRYLATYPGGRYRETLQKQP